MDIQLRKRNDWIKLQGAMNETLGPLKIYIVEDSPIIRRLLASASEAAHAEIVGSSADAQTAIKELSHINPDLILIDLVLESGTGFDVMKALREQSLAPTAIKIVLTNYGNAEFEESSFRLGADFFFEKSTELSQVLLLISHMAAERGIPPRRSVLDHRNGENGNDR
ncbi:MAG TPA: response regulator [Casimicrobiaceae bacterium]|jgi:DNA-binding NarL/FixJ family response regulator